MLKRVEVLTGGASSVYGADAVAGVVELHHRHGLQRSASRRPDFRLSAQQRLPEHRRRQHGLRRARPASIAFGRSGYDYPKGSGWDGKSIDINAALRRRLRRWPRPRHGLFRLSQAERGHAGCARLQRLYAEPCGSARFAASPAAVRKRLAPARSSCSTPFAGAQSHVQRPSSPGRAELSFLDSPRSTMRRTITGFVRTSATSVVFSPITKSPLRSSRTWNSCSWTTRRRRRSRRRVTSATPMTINCDNPFIRNATATICQPGNLINGFIGTFPTAVSAGYNPTPGAPPINFFDARGNTYNEAYFQVLRRNVEGGPRQNNLKHTTFRGVIGTRGDLSNAFSYDAYYQYGKTNYSQVYKNEFSVSSPRQGAERGQRRCQWRTSFRSARPARRSFVARSSTTPTRTAFPMIFWAAPRLPRSIT